MNAFTVLPGITREATMINPASRVTTALESFALSSITTKDISGDSLIQRRNYVQQFMQSLVQRVKKNKYSLPLGEPLYSGPLFDGTATTVDGTEARVLLLVTISKFRYQFHHAGYYQLSVSSNPKYDRWRALRPTPTSSSISPKCLASCIRNIVTHGVTHSGREDATIISAPLDGNDNALGPMEDSSHTPMGTGGEESENACDPILIRLGSNPAITINVVPTVRFRRKQDPEEIVFVTEPYKFDENRNSDVLWRCDFMKKEKQMLSLMDSADRGARRRVYQILKVCCRTDSALRPICTPHILLTVLMQTFDVIVDTGVRWQRQSMDELIFLLLVRLRRHLSTATLSHFFLTSLNLLEHAPPGQLSVAKCRIDRLVKNENELLRLLSQHHSFWGEKTGEETNQGWRGRKLTRLYTRPPPISSDLLPRASRLRTSQLSHSQPVQSDSLESQTKRGSAV